MSQLLQSFVLSGSVGGKPAYVYEFDGTMYATIPGWSCLGDDAV